MHPSESQITALAAGQHGLVTVRQVCDLGGSRSLVERRCAAGQWRRMHRGVYRVGGAPATFAQRVMAALLAAGPGAMVSHRTALRLWGIYSGSVPIEITVPRGRSFRARGVITHTSRDLHLADPQVIDGITVTGLGRTLLDVGAVVPGQVWKAAMAALRTHPITWDDLLRTLVHHSSRGRACAALRSVVAEHYGEVAGDSATEDLAHRLLLDSGVVPRPERQVRVMCADGREVTADLGWPRWRVLVEIQGIDHLTNRRLQHIDMHRLNQLALAGYAVLVYSGALLRRQPDQFVADARGHLVRAGWDPS